jgi:hypothetical protein
LVFLIGPWAFKVPYVKYGWYENTGYRSFLYGLLANDQERRFSSLSQKLCPVVFGFPFGLLLVMRRAEPMDRELSADEYDAFVNQDGAVLPVEHKWDSFGILNGQIVAVDYGS